MGTQWSYFQKRGEDGKRKGREEKGKGKEKGIYYKASQ